HPADCRQWAADVGAPAYRALVLEGRRWYPRALDVLRPIVGVLAWSRSKAIALSGLAVLDGSFASFRSSLGHTGLINHRRSDMQATRPWRGSDLPPAGPGSCSDFCRCLCKARPALISRARRHFLQLSEDGQDALRWSKIVVDAEISGRRARPSSTQ